jgi:hypothetical protein
MARRVRLHIGTMKSATTYLQDLCEQHLDHLAESGIYWPGGVLKYAAIRAFFGRAEPQTDPPEAWSILSSRVREHANDVVLSNELLAALDRAKVERLMAAFAPTEAHVVITARDPARVIPSAWQTAIRNGVKTFSWADFSSAVCADIATVETPSGSARSADPILSDVDEVHEWFWRQHDLVRLVHRWQEFVPRERITIVTVPPAGSDRQVVSRRFGSAIGVNLAGLTEPKRTNSRLGAYSSELVRRVNLAMQGAAQAERTYGIKTALAASTLGLLADSEPGFGLSETQHSWVRRRATQTVEALRLSGVRIEGDLDELIPDVIPPSGGVDPTTASDGQLLQTAVQGLIGMAKNAARLRIKCDDLRTNLAMLQVERDVLQQRLSQQEVGPNGGQTRRSVVPDSA